MLFADSVAGAGEKTGTRRMNCVLLRERLSRARNSLSSLFCAAADASVIASRMLLFSGSVRTDKNGDAPRVLSPNLLWTCSSELALCGSWAAPIRPVTQPFSVYHSMKSGQAAWGLRYPLSLDSGCPGCHQVERQRRRSWLE